MSKLSFMFIGDVHLGRVSPRLPQDFAAYDLDPAALTPAAALSMSVRYAVERGVSGVIFAGDVVDEMNDAYGALAHLQAAIKVLADAGIPTFAVAGNHDYEALPRIARQVRGFHLLGAGGTWENVVLADAVQLTGWSFPCRKVDRSPLQYGFDRLSLSATLPSFGVLHCDLDGAGRSYAPVTRSELALHQPPRGWLLGHVHQPSALSPGAPIGYLGSLMGLDPNEKGAHGPWLLGVGPQGIDLEHQALSPLRWEEINISDSAVIDSDDAMEICAHACKNAHEAVMTSPFLPRAVGCRIRMSGRSRHAARLRRALELNEFTQYRAFIDGVLYFIDKVHLDLQLPIDLAARAQGNDPVGILARHLLALETGDPAAASLLATTRAGLERELDNIAYYQRLPVVELSDGQVRDLLLQAGRQALERLVLAREESP